MAARPLTLGQVIYKVSNVESPDKSQRRQCLERQRIRSDRQGPDLPCDAENPQLDRLRALLSCVERYAWRADLTAVLLTSITVGGKALASTSLQGKRQRQTISWLCCSASTETFSPRTHQRRPCRSARRSQSPTRPDSTAMRSSEAPATSTPSTWNTPTIPTHGRTTTTSPATRLKSAPVKSHYARSTPKAKSPLARNSPSPKAPATKRL